MESSSAVLPHRPAGGPGRAAPLKPWEVRGSASASRPALPSSPSPSGITTPTSTNTTSTALTTTPRPPARPWERSQSRDYGALSRYDDSPGSPYGRDLVSSRDRYGSSYGGYGSGSSYGGYGSSYGGYGSGSSYGSGYGGYGSSGYGGGGYGGYGSSYGSGYGSSYGGGYGRDRDLYGSSMGGYGGGYGGYGGYGGGYGNNGGFGYGQGPFDKPTGLVASGFSWMHSVQYVVDTFSRFSRLLDANYDAMHGSFTSVLRLCERMGQLNSEVMMMIKTFTLFRLLQSFSSRFTQVFRYMTGRPMVTDGKDQKGKGFNVKDFKEFSRNGEQPRAPGWGAMMMVFFVTFVGLPVVLHRLVTAFSRTRNNDQLELQWGQPPGQERVRALYSFQPETSRDLAFQAGDVLVVLSKGHPDWWEAEMNGRAGLIPSNYVEPVDSTDVNNSNNTAEFDRLSRHPPD